MERQRILKTIKDIKPLEQFWVFQYYGPDLKIEAPWGEEQIVKNGDMIVSTGKDSYDDIYSIQIDIFKNTYRQSL